MLSITSPEISWTQTELGSKALSFDSASSDNFMCTLPSKYHTSGFSGWRCESRRKCSAARSKSPSLIKSFARKSSALLSSGLPRRSHPFRRAPCPAARRRKTFPGRSSGLFPAPQRLSCTPADGDKASRDCCTQVQGAERSARAIHSLLQQRQGHHVLPRPSPGRKPFAPAHPRQWLRIGPSTREKQRRAPSRGER